MYLSHKRLQPSLQLGFKGGLSVAKMLWKSIYGRFFSTDEFARRCSASFPLCESATPPQRSSLSVWPLCSLSLQLVTQHKCGGACRDLRTWLISPFLWKCLGEHSLIPIAKHSSSLPDLTLLINCQLDWLQESIMDADWTDFGANFNQRCWRTRTASLQRSPAKTVFYTKYRLLTSCYVQAGGSKPWSTSSAVWESPSAWRSITMSRRMDRPGHFKTIPLLLARAMLWVLFFFFLPGGPLFILVSWRRLTGSIHDVAEARFCDWRGGDYVLHYGDVPGGGYVCVVVVTMIWQLSEELDHPMVGLIKDVKPRPPSLHPPSA